MSCKPLVIFNPKILKSEGRTTYEEGCLSVPTFFEEVDRYDYIEVEYMNEKGEKVLAAWVPNIAVLALSTVFLLRLKK